MSRTVSLTIHPDNNPVGTQYQIERSVDPTFFTGVEIVRTWAISKTHVDTVDNGFKYYYRAKAKDASGDESNWSNVIDIIVPVSAGELVASVIEPEAITLSWAAVPQATNYRVMRDNVQIYSGVNLTYADTGLSPATTYEYKLIASNVNGEGAPDILSVKTAVQEPVIDGELDE